MTPEDKALMDAGRYEEMSVQGLQELQGTLAPTTAPQPAAAPTSPPGPPQSPPAPAGAPPVPSPAPMPQNPPAAPQTSPGGIQGGTRPPPIQPGQQLVKPPVYAYQPATNEQYIAEEASKLPRALKYLVGMGYAGKALQQRVKQLTGQDVSEQEIKDWRALEAGAGPEGMAGNITAQIAPAIVGGAGAQLASKALPAAVSRYGALSGGGGALWGGVSQPVIEDESTKANMIAGGLGGLGGHAVGRGIAGVVRPSEEAKFFLDRGVVPTPGQAGTGFMGSLARGSENVMRLVPGLRSYIGQAQERGEKEAVDLLARRSDPYATQGIANYNPARGGYFKQFDDPEYQIAYDEVLKKARIPTTQAWIDTSNAAVQKHMKSASPGMQAKVNKHLDTLFPTSTTPAPGNFWKGKLDEIRRLKNDAQRSYDQKATRDGKMLLAAYTEMEKRMVALGQKSLGKAGITRLDEIDEAFANQRIMRAAGAKSGGDTRMQDIIDVVEKETPRSKLLTKEGRAQDITEPAKKVFGEETGVGALEKRFGNVAAAGLVGGGALTTGLTSNPLFLAPLGMSLAGGWRRSTRAMLGDTKFQRYASEYLRNRLPMYGIAADRNPTEYQPEEE